MDNTKTYNELTPRELCKKCYNWSYATGEPWDDIGGCTSCDGYNRAHDYLMGYIDDCQYFEED